MQVEIEQIETDQATHGEARQGAASAEQVAQAKERLHARFGATLPEDYAAFLRHCNGLDYNGLVLYGATQSEGDPGKNGFWQGLVAANTAWREGQGHEGYIVLGETDMDLFTVAPDGSGPVLRDKVSSDVNELFETVAQGLESLLQRRL